MPLIELCYCARGSSMLKAFFVTYCVASGQRVWLKTALPAETAFALGRQLAKMGRKPIVTAVSFSIAELDRLVVKTTRKKSSDHKFERSF